MPTARRWAWVVTAGGYLAATIRASEIRHTCRAWKSQTVRSSTPAPNWSDDQRVVTNGGRAVRHRAG